MPQLTLDEVLRMPAFRQAGPVVLAGARLDRPLRWVHVTELTDIAPLLRPGDLVLTTGMSIPDDPAGLERFATSLADAESAGLVIELGRRWDELPAALVAACDAVGLPLVALTHETRFAALTQAVGERIVDQQLAELRDAQRVHETFTELSFAQAGPSEVLDAVQRLAGGPVVLESADHRPLDFLAGSDEGTSFLENWHARSVRVQISERTGWDERNGWLVTRLGTREQAWGRLVISSPTPPAQRLVAVAERAAAALALHRLHDRNRHNLIRRTHDELIAALQAQPNSEEVRGRCEIAGFPTQRRSFIAVLLRPLQIAHGSADADELVGAAVRAAHAVRAPALVSEVDRDVRMLLSLVPSVDADALVDRLARRVLRQHEVAVASGRLAEDRAGIERTLAEARQVADAVTARGPMATGGADAGSGEVLVHRLEDLHLRGLLALLGDDDRVRLFTARELEPLRRHEDGSRGGDLIPALRALLSHPSSKSDAAASLHLSRAAFYDRLAKIERLIGASLDDPDIRVSLHVALLADEMSGDTG